MNRLRILLLFLAVVGALVVISVVTSRPKKPGQTPVAAVASGTPAGGLVQPTPIIPLPKTCPPQTAAQVDNAARYGFCTPVDWGAYNENNSLAVTLIMLPRPGSNPILMPTDFDRIKILIALDLPAPADLPGECKGPANDSIAGLATHHCTATLDPAANPYHGVRAEYWITDVFGDQKFPITAIIDADATDEEQAMVGTIVHSVTPPRQP
jgi:hypothetical protein